MRFLTLRRLPTQSLLGAAAVLLAMAGGAAPAAAQTNLITNGSFENVGTQTQSYQINTANPLPGWTVAPSGSNTLTCLVYKGANSFCGPGYGGPTGPASFSTPPGVSPNGGNAVVGDADPGYDMAISQTVNGLTVGAQYSLAFYQASSEQAGFSGPTTEQWQVTFGSAVQYSTKMTTTSSPLTGTGWMLQTMTFTAAAPSQVISFLAANGPTGLPPLAFLDGVSLTAAPVPEPASLTLLGTAVLGLMGLRRRAARGRARCG